MKGKLKVQFIRQLLLKLSPQLLRKNKNLV